MTDETDDSWGTRLRKLGVEPDTYHPDTEFTIRACNWKECHEPLVQVHPAHGDPYIHQEHFRHGRFSCELANGSVAPNTTTFCSADCMKRYIESDFELDANVEYTGNES